MSLSPARVMPRAPRARRAGRPLLALAALTVLASVLSLAAPAAVLASATVGAATGGTGLTLWASSPLYGPTLTEHAAGDVGTGTIVLRVPSAFIFSSSAPVTVTVTNAGCRGNDKPLRLSGAGGLTDRQTVGATDASVTVTVGQRSTGRCRGTVTWAGIRVLAVQAGSGTLTHGGTSAISGVAVGTSFGALSASAPPTATATPTPTATATATSTATATATATATSTNTPAATLTATATATATLIPSSTSTSTAMPAASATPAPPSPTPPAAPGTPWAWGRNGLGELGDGTTVDRLLPVGVSNLSNVTAVSAGLGHSLAVKDGQVWTWGRDWTSRPTTGESPPTTSPCYIYTYAEPCHVTPVAVAGLADVTAVAASSGYSMALRADGTVWEWSQSSPDPAVPAQVPGLSGVRAIARGAGASHSLALKADGTVWAWGGNSYGQLGDGTHNHGEAPVRVLNLTGVVAIATGDEHSLALKADGTVWAWGYNYYGQAGDGTREWYRTTPVRVAGLPGATAIAAGAFHSLAATADGVVFAWGADESGILGQNWQSYDGGCSLATGTPCSLNANPVANFNSPIAALASGRGHALALLTGGTLKAWGANYAGQLGDGTTASRSFPVTVALGGVLAVSGGGEHTLAVSSSVWTSPTPGPSPSPIPSASPTPTTPLTFPSHQSVAYQVNPSHSGAIQLANFAPPLTFRWSVDLGQTISYPLVAGGKVFVTVAQSATGGYGTRLFALHAQTGSIAWGPIDIPGTYYWSGTAYEDGRLFVLSFDGVLQARDAQTGAQIWQRSLDGYSFDSPPTAAQGIVYAVGNAGLSAVDATTGSPLWRDSVYGSHTSPTLSDDGVFTSAACAATDKRARLGGAPLWSYFTGCTGGGGRTAVYHQGLLFVRDPVGQPAGYVLNAQTGALVRRFDAGPAPAFLGATGYVVHNGVLRAENVTSGSVLWTFAGDGTIASAPLVVNDHVYVASTSGALFAVAAASGQQVWRGDVGATVPAPDEHNVSAPLAGLGAGEGLLVVPAGGRLVAFG